MGKPGQAEQAYDFKAVEEKWLRIFEEKALFKQDLRPSSKEKFYVLEMFSYPSGKMHMGHVRNYTLGDVLARYKRAKGFSVLHPVGWDAFGLPAENAAIENKTNPKTWTLNNVKEMGGQFRRLGFFYDWSNETATCNENYYRWGQWLFIQMFKRGLIEQKKSPVNWCSDCNTVLANEQVVDGACWRHPHTKVQTKLLKQWYIRITDYAQALLDDHKLLEGNWPSEVLVMQKNWIGKSHGVLVNFKCGNEDFPIYTTRVDTLYGATFCAVAFDHPNLAKYLPNQTLGKEMKDFIADCSQDENDEREKKGIFSGSYLTHPLTNEKIPLYVADFVLAGHGTGAIMCVPAHDERDFLFAKKHALPIKIVVQNKEKTLNAGELKNAYSDEGILVDSAEFSGMTSSQAKEALADFVEKKSLGKKTSWFRLKDWLISRQRYWGNPIPLLHCPKCGVVAEKEENLPARLPEDVDFSLKDNPVKSSKTFLNAPCPQCGGDAKRETDTMDTFFCSSWYYLRFVDPHNAKEIFSKESERYWMDVDKYIGGIEHACMHLLYARFVHKVLKDMGLVKSAEPFKSLLTQGMVLSNSHYDTLKRKYYDAKELEELDEATKKSLVVKMEKMGKSKKNGVDPDEVVETYGADAARLFILFAGPPSKNLEWSVSGIEGCQRFLRRVWNYAWKLKEWSEGRLLLGHLPSFDESILKELHKTVKKVDEDSNELHPNTAIAALMEFFNHLQKFAPKDKNEAQRFVEVFLNFLKLLNPFAPFISEEMNAKFDAKLLWDAAYPDYEAKYLQSSSVVYTLQVNGKIRSELNLEENLEKDAVVEIALNDPKIKKWLEGKSIAKTVFVPKRLVNFVVKDES